MAEYITDEIEYYYDSHSTEEDLMGETAFHDALTLYLLAVLTRFFDEQPYAIHHNLNIYQTSNPQEYPLAPDIAVYKGLPFQWVRSWRVGTTGPAPLVVFEIASAETWAKDLGEKPTKYAQMGVQEYFAYDPNEPPLPRSRSQRLFGWKLDLAQGIMRPMTPGAHGELWSEQLQSWLVPDGEDLRLYDRSWHVRLTRDEAEAQRAENEARQKEIQRQRAENEARRAENEARRADEATRRAEAEARRIESLEEKLRSLGIDPDQIR